MLDKNYDKDECFNALYAPIQTYKFTKSSQNVLYNKCFLTCLKKTRYCSRQICGERERSNGEIKTSNHRVVWLEKESTWCIYVEITLRTCVGPNSRSLASKTTQVRNCESYCILSCNAIKHCHIQGRKRGGIVATNSVLRVARFNAHRSSCA